MCSISIVLVDTGRVAVLAVAVVTVGLLAMTEQFHELPAALVAFAAAHVIASRGDAR